MARTFACRRVRLRAKRCVGLELGEAWSLEREACSPPLTFLEKFRDHLKRLGHFSLQVRKFHGQHGALGINHDVDSRALRKSVQPHCLTQSSLDPIALHCSAKRLADCKTDTRPGWFLFRSPQIKNSYVRPKVPPSLLVDSFKVCVPQKLVALGEALLLRW